MTKPVWAFIVYASGKLWIEGRKVSSATTKEATKKYGWEEDVKGYIRIEGNKSEFISESEFNWRKSNES